MNIRLYHPNSIVENKTSLLSKEHTHYLANVLRVKLGSNLYLFNKNGEWKSEIIFLDKNRVEVKFLDKVKEPINMHDVQLAICLVKKTPLDIILQKSTELGVSKIIPLISERTEVRELNYDRAKKIIIEATEQSNQLNPPSIDKITKLDEFLKNISEKTKLLFADINFKEKNDCSNLKKSKSITILIGPEGDFSPNERRLITLKENVIPFSLSKNILRTDTAVISAISLVNFIINEH
tara:strand:- start:244 stop:954 length:711 start_codon:yes stop_codon:yes gene_type:complete